MSPRSKTRDVSKTFYRNYLQKAGECLHGARNSFSAQEWNSSTISAIHACISGCDAMCVYFLGKRNASDNHNDAVTLFKSIKNDESFNTNANRISTILRLKNMAEYEERLVYRSEAEKILKNCERFLEFVKKALP